MIQLPEFLVRLRERQEKFGEVWEAGSEIIVYVDSIGDVRIKEYASIVLQPEDYDMVVDERDYYKLLLYVGE